MEFVRTFLELNREVIQFAYGLTFFVLGLAIALQSRQHSRLDLARGLPWLAAFGFTHGLHEWGDFFIPIQSAYLSQTIVLLLMSAQTILLAASFACLMEFGVQLLRPPGRNRVLHVLPAGLLAGWLVIVFLVLPPLFPVRGIWQNTASALARYFIGFPGGLFAAYALRRHAIQRLAPLNAPHIIRMLRVSGVAMALYAIFGGLIPAPVPFFPGNWLNSLTFEQTVGVSPMVFRSAIGFVLATAIIRALEIFDLETERFIESMEQQQILSAERERIARELHDGVIQKIYTAGLLVESAGKQTPGESPTAQRLDKAAVVLNDAIADLRRNLGELRAVPSGHSLYHALRVLEEDPRLRTLVDLQLDLDLPADETLTPARADEVMAIVNEALSNAIRHAGTRRVKIGARRVNGRLKVTVEDDGVGLPTPLVPGYGLRNMRDRARMLGGNLDLASALPKGTVIQLDIPWSDER
jgi:signal transduction histidine kinase